MPDITIEQWTEYLNKKTHGFVCPICGQEKWETQPDNNGLVCDVKILDHGFEDELIGAIENAITTFDNVRNGKAPDDSLIHETERNRPQSLLKSVVVIRCGHCGWVGTFDRAFVEREIFGHE